MEKIPLFWQELVYVIGVAFLPGASQFLQQIALRVVVVLDCSFFGLNAC